MTISPISPSFCGLRQKIRTQRNMLKVAQMIGQTGVYTEFKKDGDKGGFIVTGTDIKKMGNKPCIAVTYSPDFGLQTYIKDRTDDNILFVAHQAQGKEPQVYTYYKGIDVSRNVPISKEALEKLEKPIIKTIDELLFKEDIIYKSLGNLIPTLNDIKE